MTDVFHIRQAGVGFFLFYVLFFLLFFLSFKKVLYSLMTFKKKRTKLFSFQSHHGEFFMTIRILLRGACLLSESVCLILGHQFHYCVFYHFLFI